MLSELPLVDLSQSGRALRSAKQGIKEFSALLDKGLKAEAAQSEDEQLRIAQARARLKASVEQLIQSIEMAVNRSQAAAILEISNAVMFACADAASRIDRKLVPRLIRPSIEAATKKSLGAPGGLASGKSRRAEAEETWKPHALCLAKKIRQEQPSITQCNLAVEIAERWGLQIPCPKTHSLAPSRAGRKPDYWRSEISDERVHVF
jgi:hypothetical protein